MYQKGQRTRIDATMRKIESMFYRQKAIEKAIYYARMDTGKGHTGGTGGHSYVSDPTAIQGIKAATELPSVTLNDGNIVHSPEAWIRVIRASYRQGDDTQRKALKMRYEGYRRDVICDELSIAKPTYHFLINNAHQFAIAAACQEGLIKVM